MKPHKHAELIKAWADGAEIERKEIYCRYEYNSDVDVVKEKWVYDRSPTWGWNVEYRIKPEPKTEPEKQWMYIYCNAHENKTWISPIEPSYYMNVAHWTCIGKIEVLK